MECDFEMTKALGAVKQALTRAPALALPDHKKPFSFMCMKEEEWSWNPDPNAGTFPTPGHIPI